MGAGTGFVDSPSDTLRIAIIALVVVGGVLLFATLIRRPRRAIAAAATTFCVVAIGAGLALASVPAPTLGGMMGFPAGAAWGDDAGVQVKNAVITAQPGEPFVFSFELTSEAALPVRIDGVVNSLAAPAFPYWESVTYSATDGHGGTGDALGAAVLEPFDLQPARFAQLNLVAHASSCADPAAEASNG